MKRTSWPKLRQSLKAIAISAISGSFLAIAVSVVVGVDIWPVAPEDPRLLAGLALITFVYMAVFGLPIQAVMHRFGLDHLLWFLAAGTVAGGLPLWELAGESASDQLGMGATLHYGLTWGDWTVVAFGIACGVVYAFLFWIVRRPDRDSKKNLTAETHF